MQSSLSSNTFLLLNHFSLHLKKDDDVDDEVDDVWTVFEQLYWQNGDLWITFSEIIDPTAIIVLINTF